MLNKQEWVMKHWHQTGNEKIKQPVGEIPHNPKFKYLGWVWTPKLCLCNHRPPCLLDTSEKVKRDKRRYL